jgi:hypothetical protein
MEDKGLRNKVSFAMGESWGLGLLQQPGISTSVETTMGASSTTNANASPQTTTMAPQSGMGRRTSTWARMKRTASTTAQHKQSLSLLEAFVSSSKKSLAAEAREERLEEMEEAHELRNCSLSSVCSTFHPARNNKMGGFSSGSTGSSGQYNGMSGRSAQSAGSMGARGPPTEVLLVEQTDSHISGDVVVSVKEIPTFSRRDKIFFLFSGVPNTLRAAQELQLWITPSSIVSNFTLFVVTLSCISFCVESLPEYYDVNSKPFYLTFFSYVCMIWLTFELCFRLIFCQDIAAMLKLPFTWVDIVSNIPYYIELVSGARVARILILIRLLRLTRILRVFDLSKHNVGMQSVWGSVVKSVSGLTLLLLLLTVILFVGSSIIYIAEMTEEDFDNSRNVLYYVPSGRISPFQSILHTLWYVIATITTTGYGEDVPITPAGYATASILILIGPFVIAFPTVILSANFQETHRELMDAIEGAQNTRTEMSAEESRRLNEKKNAEFAAVMRQYVPKKVQDEKQRRTELLDGVIGKADLTYSLTVGAPPRNIVIRQGVALYDPLLMMRCAYADGEPEYGFQSNTGVTATVRDNFPSGSIVRFQVLLHTAFTQEAAIMAVHQHLKKFPNVNVTTVAPRPIRILRVSMRSKHALLAHIHLVCSKYRDPYGTIPIEVVLTKPEALPVLLRYASSCSFHFAVEFHDSTSLDTTVMLGLSDKTRVEYRGADETVGKLLANAFPNANVEVDDDGTWSDR